LTPRHATDTEEMTFLLNLCNICTAHLLTAFGNGVFSALARVCACVRARVCVRQRRRQMESWNVLHCAHLEVSKATIILHVSEETARDRRCWSGSWVGSHTTHWKRHSAERYHYFQTFSRIEEAVIPVSAPCGPVIISPTFWTNLQPMKRLKITENDTKVSPHRYVIFNIQSDMIFGSRFSQRVISANKLLWSF
jgi:hypothetical protein